MHELAASPPPRSCIVVEETPAIKVPSITQTFDAAAHPDVALTAFPGVALVMVFV
jgi:hypothetical protein